MEWIEPVGATSGTKYSSSLGNTGEDRSSNLIHGSFAGILLIYFNYNLSIFANCNFLKFLEDDAVWFATGDRLDVLSTKQSRMQSRHFHCAQGQEFEVTCVASIANEPLALIGLSSNTGSGAVALYNYSTSLILNSWSISHKVIKILVGLATCH